MSDWSKGAAERLRQHREVEGAETQARLLEHRVIATNGPDLWKQLREAFTVTCVELNAESGMRDTLKCDLSSPTEIRIEDTHRKTTAHISFEAHKGRVLIGTSTASKYTLAVSPDYRDVHFEDE